MYQNVNAWIKMLYLGLTFGLSLTILKVIFQTIDDPLWILFCQSTFSSILLLAFALFSKSDLSALRYNFGALALLAAIGVIVPNVALYASARHISVGSMSLLLALIPFFCLYYSSFNQNREVECLADIWTDTGVLCDVSINISRNTIGNWDC